MVKYIRAIQFMVFLVIGLVLFLPAPHQVIAGGPTMIMSSPGLPPVLDIMAGAHSGAEYRIAALDRASRDLFPDPQFLQGSDPSAAGEAGARGNVPLRTAAGYDRHLVYDDTRSIVEPDNERTVALTGEEYEALLQVIKPGAATPLQVALVNAAVVGTKIIIVMLAFVIGLVIMRRIFDRWWDQDLYNDTWASMCVVIAKLIVLGWILTATVRG